MATIYRSVKVVLQNSTNELLTVEGFDALSGSWTPDNAPSQGQPIPLQSAAQWQTESVELGLGTQAYVRMGSTKGYITVAWQQPWAGRFGYWVDAPDGLEPLVRFNLEEPAMPVMLVTLSPSGRPEEGVHELSLEEAGLASLCIDRGASLPPAGRVGEQGGREPRKPRGGQSRQTHEGAKRGEAALKEESGSEGKV